jgi:hypothetical protein
MHRLSEVVRWPRKGHKPNYVQLVKRIFNLASNVISEYDLNANEKSFLEQMRSEFEQGPDKHWRRYLGAQFQFEDPELVNYELLRDQEDPADIYVYFALAKPGKCEYTVHTWD